MSLVGAAGKLSLGRGRKKQVEAAPEGTRSSWDREEAPGRVRL